MTGCMIEKISAALAVTGKSTVYFGREAGMSPGAYRRSHAF